MGLTIDRILPPCLFQAQERQQLTDLLAQGYLQAKAFAYQRAQQEVGSVVLLRHAWEVKPSDVKAAQTWASQQVEGILSTYETLLCHQLEALPTERALGDILGGIRDIISSIGNWFADLFGWKPEQIGGSTWDTGESDGTKQWINDVQQEDAIDGDISNIYVQVIPETSSKDACELIAGQTFPLADAPNVPLHVNCIHSLRVILKDG